MHKNKGLMSRLLTVNLLVACSLLSGAVTETRACPSSSQTPSPKAEAETKDVVDTAISAGKFNSLAKALGAAGLVEVLKGKGPYTVFAPDDDAFAKLPAESLNSLLADKDKLAKVLKLHVVDGTVTAKKVARISSVKSIEGESLAVKKTDGKIAIGDANVIAADIKCSNGVIHVIDKVLLPQ